MINKIHKNIEGYQYNGGTNNERLNQRMDMWKYDEPVWGTYTQWVKNDRYVKRGEKGTCLFGVNRDDSLRVEDSSGHS